MKYNALNYLILKLVLVWNFDKGRTVTRNKFLLFLIFVKVIKHLRTRTRVRVPVEMHVFHISNIV